MITEIAEVEIIAGQELEFEDSLARAVTTVLSKAKGFISFTLKRGIESPGRYTFLIEWQNLEDHTIGFRESDLFVQWRAIIGKHFASPPKVEHWSRVSL